jgi:hypothetical protein
LLIPSDEEPIEYYEITPKGKRYLQLFAEMEDGLRAVYGYRKHSVTKVAVYCRINYYLVLIPDLPPPFASFAFIALVTVIAATLVGIATIIADSALATKYREKNQVISQANACGNDDYR